MHSSEAGHLSLLPAGHGGAPGAGGGGERSLQDEGDILPRPPALGRHHLVRLLLRKLQVDIETRDYFTILIVDHLLV